MFYYLIPALIPISLLYYNYQIYKKLEILYKKTINIEKKINYYLNYQYIEPIQDIKSSNNIILDSKIEPQLDTKLTSDCENKIYLVL